MLGQRLRRWPNIKTALGRCLMFAGIYFRQLSTENVNLTRTPSQTKIILLLCLLGLVVYEDIHLPSFCLLWIHG